MRFVIVLGEIVLLLRFEVDVVECKGLILGYDLTKDVKDSY